MNYQNGNKLCSIFSHRTIDEETILMRNRKFKNVKSQLLQHNKKLKKVNGKWNSKTSLKTYAVNDFPIVLIIAFCSLFE